ncbi:hypothetical protein GOP47_0023946 [Adiantum capillus-veneris]|uniref:Uncharacterized protein n=1 Tax=Adiantum capillus-veneris TaxID=13818 RepID=A0A9D4U6Z7_ADICA|nr:hypothetical protein GOP47_0023946 [Adiantum capillus-veneris]
MEQTHATECLPLVLHQKAEAKAAKETPQENESLPIVLSEDNELLEWLESARDPHYFAILTGMEEDTGIKEEVESLGLREPITNHKSGKKLPM